MSKKRAAPSQNKYRQMRADRVSARLAGVPIGSDEVRETVRIPARLAEALDRIGRRAAIERKYSHGDGAGRTKMPDGRTLDISKNALIVKAIERLPELKVELAEMSRDAGENTG